MFRQIELELKKWRDLDNPHPLLIRGARQVGKSFTVKKFAEENFENYVEINFEYDFDFYEDFASLDPQQIINQIFIKRNIEVKKNQTLIFLDEIQFFPKAIQALRYFYEKMPGLHVIAAGSLVDFALNQETISMPVGRVHYLFMHPFSFKEFLQAQEHSGFLSYIENLSIERAVCKDSSVHDLLMKEAKNYFLLGGMPAVIKEYLGHSKTFPMAFREQRQIVHTYIDDFRKYAAKSEFKFIRKVFEKIPHLVSKKFKYSQVDREIKSQYLKAALENLIDANIVSKVRATSGLSKPLELNASDSDFKTVFLDCGLAQNILSANNESLYISDFSSGLISEQFVGQELKVCRDPYSQAQLFYWFNDAKNASAEIDYLLEFKNEIIPVEVKSATRGRLKSLRFFMKQFSSKLGIKISSAPLSLDSKILNIPFYAISQLPRLIADLL